jgi:hypothetical protein
MASADTPNDPTTETKDARVGPFTDTATCRPYVTSLICRPRHSTHVHEQKRREALRVADRYALVNPRETDDRIREIRRTLFDTGSALRSDARSLTWPAHLFCRFIARYDLEGGAHAILGLGEMAGDSSYSETQRCMQLDWAYVALRAAQHLSSNRRQFISEEVTKVHREQLEAEIAKGHHTPLA